MKKRSAKNSLVPVGIMLLAVVVFVMVFLDMNSGSVKQTTKSTVAMGTVITEKIYGGDSEAAFEKTEDTITQLENKISMRINSSVIASLNKNGEAECDDELFDVFEICENVRKESDGAFDITMGKLTSLWKIGEEGATVPSEKELKKALSYVDGSKIKVSDGKISVGNGQCVDLGAVGKGLACDKVKSALETTDVKAAVISIGGSVLLYGSNPDADSWSVAIRDPRGESSDYIAKLSLKEGTVSTSGDYERVLEVGDKKYHHILDPKTGYPSDSGLMSVTVVSESGILSDALSTAAFVLGTDDGVKLLKKFGAEGIFVDKDKNVTVTDGLSDKFTLTDSDYTLIGGSR